MARSESHTVPYFPFYVKDGRTLFLLESKYQCKGTGFFTNVMRVLSNTPDHHVCLENELDRRMFFAGVKCDEESALDMITMMVITGKLDRELWDKKQVVFSEDFRLSIEDAYRKRSNKIITKSEIYAFYGLSSGNTPEQSAGNPDNSAGNPLNSGSYPQSKVEKSKVKERRGEEIPPLPVDNSRREEAEILVAEFYAALSKKIGRKICPGDDEDILAEKLLEKQEASLDDASGMIPVYLSCTDWWMYDRADKAREHPLYSFTAFCKHYTDLMTKPKPRERKRVGIPCPKCGEGILVGDPPYCSAECGYGEGTDKAGSGTTEDPDDW